MIRSLPSEGVNYLVGENTIETRPLEPYSELALAFLDALSEALTRLPEIADYPDIRTFAFWCRKGNIQSLRKAFLSQDTRLGLGLVLHITPSNVPIHFVFSYAFGLLAGNANVVRVPSKPFPQVKILANAVNQVFEKKEHAEIKKMTAWVTYPPDAKINLEMSSHCRARMIWGGDETIRELRQVALPPQSVELVFADRYSLCLLDAPSILALDGGELKNLAMRFFNDGFLMDQNACSSPHLVVWLGDEKVSARDVFWKAVGKVASEKLSLPHLHAIEKYVQVCEDALAPERDIEFAHIDNHIYLLHLKRLPQNVDNLSGRFGYFYEYDAPDLESLKAVVSPKIQTMTFFGIERARLLDFILKNRLSGIDRLVPVGRALDISVIWDGVDIVRSLSRIIDCDGPRESALSREGNQHRTPAP